MRIYLYVHANPVNGIDPSGHLMNAPSVGVGSAGAAAIGAHHATVASIAYSHMVSSLVFKIGAYTIAGTATAVSTVAPAVLVITEVQRDIAVAKLKNKISEEEDRTDDIILYHYTDHESMMQIVATGMMKASRRFPTDGYVFPSGAYATDISPWSPEYSQAGLSALFYGGYEARPVDSFVAIERNDFAGPLPYEGFPNQYYRPAAEGTMVPVKVVASGPNFMNK